MRNSKYAHITIGGVQIKGSRVRSIFGLRSACFTCGLNTRQIYGYGS